MGDFANHRQLSGLLVKHPVTVAKANAGPAIEGETQAEAINRAREFIDGLPELNRASTNVIAGRWAL